MHIYFRVFFLTYFFLFYIPQAYSEKSIAIFTCYCGVKPWDPDSINSGITGSEEAIIYLSKELSQLNYKVTVFADPPSNSPYTLPDANPRYVSIKSMDNTKHDIGIAWRSPYNGEILKKQASYLYYWPHDTLHYPISLEQINEFTDTFWLSKWQRKQHMTIHSAFAKFNHYFGNGIVPEQFEPIQERANPYSCIYGSNYARGLEILLDIWPEIKKQFPKATLDIYYGWQHWGLLSMEKEKIMKEQVASLASLGVTEHGMVGHAELNKAYSRASFWTYPCIAPETFCITGLRAQLSGAIPVIIEGSALSETVRHGYKCQQRENYQATLIKALKDAENISLADRKKMGDFILKEYTWKAIAEKWDKVFQQTASNN